MNEKGVSYVYISLSLLLLCVLWECVQQRASHSSGNREREKKVRENLASQSTTQQILPYLHQRQLSSRKYHATATHDWYFLLTSPMVKDKKGQKGTPGKKTSSRVKKRQAGVQDIYQFDEEKPRGKSARAVVESEEDSDDDGIGGDDESVDDEGEDIGWDRYIRPNFTVSHNAFD